MVRYKRVDQAPIDRVLLNGDYRTISSCAYERLDKAAGNGIKKVDLDGSTRLALESGGVRYWELLFRPAGKNETRVDFTVVQTVWGPDTLGSGKLCRRSKPAPREAMALIESDGTSMFGLSKREALMVLVIILMGAALVSWAIVTAES